MSALYCAASTAVFWMA